MAHFNIQMDDKAILRKLEGIAHRAKDMTPVYAAFGDYILRETEGRFSSEKDPEGNAWPALSEKTKARKKGPKILTEKHFLRGSITRDVSPEMLQVGTNLDYAATHQFGLKELLSIPAHRRKVPKRNREDHSSGVSFVKAHRRKVDIPARRFLGINDADRLEFNEIVKEHILQ